ncbi:MAG: CARDB domain-containing protein [Bacteroidales bacterium]
MQKQTIPLFLTSLFLLLILQTELQATKHTILVSNFSFTPSSLPNVILGDTIRWQWVSGFHTTTSSSIPFQATAWDVLITSGNPVYEYKPTKTGTYNYVCTPHIPVGMIGSFTVSNPVALPDLVIQGPSVDPVTIMVGSSTLALCTVFNSGQGPSGTSTLRYYFSSDNVFNGGDLLLGSSAVGSLNSGTGSSQSLSLTIPLNTVTGSGYIVFVADAANVIGETNETNNSGSSQVNIIPLGNILSGVVSYDNAAGTPMPGVSIQLKNSLGDVIGTTTTNLNGVYSFNGVPDGQVSIHATTSIPWAGVNADDALAAMRHFVGMAYLTGLRQLAANVDGNSFINAMDALTITRRFVSLISTFPSGDWLFQVPAIIVSGNTSYTQNIKGICYGDVNGSNPGIGF